MKQFARECQHAKSLRENKNSYSEAEREDGCWQCSGELKLLFQHAYTPDEALQVVHMPDRDRQELADDQKKLAYLVQFLNEPRYHCETCMNRLMDESRNGPFVNLDDWVAEMKTPEYAVRRARELDAEIAGVEACGPDCPDFHRLEDLRRMRGEYVGGDVRETR